MTIFPAIVAQLITTCDAWIVGSAAAPDAKLDSLRDIDVCVPFSHWHFASCLIPKDAKVNTFGGWKCVRNGVTVDVWPQDLSRLMIDSKCRYLWQPRYGVRFSKE